MFISLSEILHILEQYKYWIIFPIAIFEGPIMVIITGFLTYLGILNGYIAYVMVVMADIIGDSLYYSIGRLWRSSTRVKKIGYFLGYDDKSEEFLEEHFRKHKMKTFFIAKIAHGVGGTVQIASGIARVGYPEFLWYSVVGTIPKVLALFLIGFYVGQSYIKINSYLHYIALITIGLAFLVLIYFIISKKLKKSLLEE